MSRSLEPPPSDSIASVAVVATLTIRDLDDDLRSRLRVRAAGHGRSMEAEVRAILHEALAKTSGAEALGTRVHQRFSDVGGVDLSPTERNEQPRAAELPA
jgi:plasmid stability protein